MRRGEFQWKSLELIIFQFSENCIRVKLSEYARFPGNKSSFSQHFELVFFYPITRKPIHQERNYDAAFSAEISTHLCRRACSIHGQGLGVILLRLLCLLLVNLKDEKENLKFCSLLKLHLNEMNSMRLFFERIQQLALLCLISDESTAATFLNIATRRGLATGIFIKKSSTLKY